MINLAVVHGMAEEALREETQATEADDERRRAQLREAVDGFKLGASITYPQAWLRERGTQQSK